jgi:hypothetical protein
MIDVSRERADATQPADAPTQMQRLIEVGWVLAADLRSPQRQAVRLARASLTRRLEELFPGFVWRMPSVLGAPATREGLEEPSVRLLEGVHEREARAWDFAVVVTARDLESYYASYALAVPSRALAVAVLSLARLAQPEDDDPETLGRRVAALAQHLFGDLNGLWHRDAPEDVMHPPDAVTELDLERRWSDDEHEMLLAALAEVADLRLEETGHSAHPVAFYARAAFDRAGEIASAVAQARPWELPLRLGRLTAAAFSALFLLMMTAEVWDLATLQTAPRIAVLSLLVVVGTTAFVVVRQKLIPRRARSTPSEQRVVRDVSAVVIVLLGMLTAYALLFGLTLVVGTVLFHAELIARWAPGAGDHGPLPPRLHVAGLVSSLGLLIGSLGASFEGRSYFRHVIYADEET